MQKNVKKILSTLLIAVITSFLYTTTAFAAPLSYNLGPIYLINGTVDPPNYVFDWWVNPAPDFGFTSRIQIDDDSAFGSPAVDYTFDLVPSPGAVPMSFEVGQAATDGTYTIGSPGQTLPAGDYHWRVMATGIPSMGASAWVEGNASGVEFTVSGASPPGDVSITSIGPSSLTSGENISDSQPTFEITIADTQNEDVKYYIQIDDADDWATPIIDYESDFDTPGLKNFTVGQAEGSGNYVVGSQGQTLDSGDYYWRVMAENDPTGDTTAWTVANDPDVAFTVVPDCVWVGSPGPNNKWDDTGNWADNDGSPTAGTCKGGFLPGNDTIVTFDSNSNVVPDFSTAGTINVNEFVIDSGYTSNINFDTSDNNLIANIIEINSGTLTFDDQTVDVGEIILNGGTFVAPSETTDIAGRFTIESGATFTHNSGTFEFTGSTSYLYENNATLEFYNLTLNKDAGSGVTLNDESQVYVDGNLRLENGYLGGNNGGGSTNERIIARGTATWLSTFDGSAGYADCSSNGWIEFQINHDLTLPDGTPWIKTTWNAPGRTMRTGGSTTIVYPKGSQCWGISGLEVSAGTFDNDGNADLDIGQLNVNGTGLFYSGTNAAIDTYQGGSILGGTATFESGSSFSSYQSGAINTQLEIDGGTFDASATSGDFLLSILTIESGTFRASSGNTTVRREMEIDSAATFDHNSGTFTFASTANGTSINNPANDPTSVTFNNLTTNHPGYYLAIYENITANVEGELRLTDGTLLKRNSVAELVAKGSVNWESTFDGAYSGASCAYPGSIELQTTGNVTLPDNPQWLDLTMNSAGNTLQTSGSTNISSTPCNTGLAIENGSFDNAVDIDMTLGYLDMTSSATAFNTGENTALTFTGSQSDIDAGTLNVETGASLTFGNELELNGGSVNASATSADLDFNGTGDSVEIISGSFSSTSGTVKVAESWTQTGGTYTHNGGTLELDGTTANVDLENSTSSRFNDITISKDNGTDDINFIGDFEAEGDILVQTGTIDPDVAQITLGGNFTLCPSAGNQLACGGAGAGDGSFEPDTSRITLNGTNQFIYGDNSNSFYDLIKQVTSPDTIYFEAGEETRITNNLTLTGISGNLLAVKSTGHATNTSADINAENIMIVDYVSIEDVNNTRGTDYDLSFSAKSHSENLDLGFNNTGWIFGSGSATPIPEFSTWILILTMLFGTGLIYNKRESMGFTS